MYSHILVPIAFDHEADTERAMDIARRLLADGGTITCLHVLERFPAYVEVQLSPEILEQTRTEAQKMLDNAVARSGVEASTEMVYGHSGRGILDFADQAGADCIIIASHDPGLQDYFLGSTASRVVRHAHCAVHVMR